MNKKTWQIQSAKNRFSELVNKASEGIPQLVTKNGKPAVYVVDYNTYNKKIAAGKHLKKEVLLKRPHKDVSLNLSRDKDTGRNVQL